jgi:hypothetical protein
MARILVICVALVCSFTAKAATIVYKSDYSQIFLVGKIVAGDLVRFNQALKASKGNVIAVNVVSVGGSVKEAIEIGRLIRKLSLGVNVPSLASYAPEARAQLCSNAASIAQSPCTCVSACFLCCGNPNAMNGACLIN